MFASKLTLAVFTACAAFAKGQGNNTIVDIAVENGSFTTLVAAVTAAGLAETLSGEGPFTVLGKIFFILFAHTDLNLFANYSSRLLLLTILFSCVLPTYFLQPQLMMHLLHFPKEPSKDCSLTSPHLLAFLRAMSLGVVSRARM